jgi:hypothetical protein
VYTIINTLVHLVVLIAFCYAFFTESTGYREKDMTLQKIVGIAGLALLFTWGFLVGELHNLKSLFALFF